MPMEKIKERLGEVAHSWSYIGMIILFLFTVQPGPTATQAVIVQPIPTVNLVVEVEKTERQLKR